MQNRTTNKTKTCPSTSLTRPDHSQTASTWIFWTLKAYIQDAKSPVISACNASTRVVELQIRDFMSQTTIRDRNTQPSLQCNFKTTKRDSHVPGSPPFKSIPIRIVKYLRPWLPTDPTLCSFPCGHASARYLLNCLGQQLHKAKHHKGHLPEGALKALFSNRIPEHCH